MRALMLDEQSKLYVTAARARGLHGRRLLWRYPARHALGPVINSLGFDLNRIFNELPIVALILTLTEAGALLLGALAHAHPAGGKSGDWVGKAPRPAVCQLPWRAKHNLAGQFARCF